MPDPSLPLLLAETAESGPAFWFGASLIPVALMFCIHRCSVIARRDIASSKCAVGLALVLGGLLAFALVGFVELLGVDASDGLAFGFLPLTGAVATFAGVVFAIVGLVQYSGIKPPLRQGRKQAWTALVLGGGVVALMAWGALQRGELDDVLDKSPFAGIGHTKTQTFEDLNFTFDAPPVGWLRLPAATINPDASVAYGNLNGELFFLLIAERLGAESAATSKDLREVAEENLRESDRSASVEPHTLLQHAGLKGVQFRAAASADGTRFNYHFNVFVHNGFGYQLITYAERRNRTELDAAARTMLERFRCIDLERYDVADDATIVTEYASPQLGYEVKLPGGKWFTSDELRQSFPEEDLVVMYRNECWLSVIALELRDESVPDAAVLRAMLNLKHYDYPDDPIAYVTESESTDRREIGFALSQDIEGTRIQSLARLVRTAGHAYLIQVDREAAHTAGAAIQAEALKRVRIVEPTPADPAGKTTPQERQTRAEFLNQIGIHYFEAGEFVHAKRWFLKALGLNDQDPDYADNAAQAMIEMEQHQEALDLLDQHQDIYRDDLDLRGDRAWLLSVVGKQDEARTEYAKLFARDHRDDEDLDCYAGLLVDAGKPDAALRLVEAYRKAEDYPNLVALHSRVLLSAKKPKQARELLEGQPKPYDAWIFDAMMDVYHATEQHKKVLEAANSLLAAERRYLKLSKAKARAELALGQFDAAAKTVADGLKRFGDDEALKAFGAQAAAGLKK